VCIATVSIETLGGRIKGKKEVGKDCDQCKKERGARKMSSTRCVID
jgi:hypothetical protein